jgi:microcystin degradation protein MlrC
MGERLRPAPVGIEEALGRLPTITAGPVVFADVADNPGGGAPGDNTFILEALIRRGVQNIAIGAFWGLGAIHTCRDAGIGATLNLRIGGKCSPASGSPIDLPVTVRAIVENYSQGSLSGREPMGTAVWVEGPNGLDIVPASIHSQIFMPDAFTGLGIDLTSKKLIVVKSMQHFHAGFAPLAKDVLYVTTPGALTQQFAEIPYVKRDLNYWPRVKYPFSESNLKSPAEDDPR